MNHENRWQSGNVQLLDSSTIAFALWARPTIDCFTIEIQVQAILQVALSAVLRQFQAEMRESIISCTFKATATALQCAPNLSVEHILYDTSFVFDKFSPSQLLLIGLRIHIRLMENEKNLNVRGIY